MTCKICGKPRRSPKVNMCKDCHNEYMRENDHRTRKRILAARRRIVVPDKPMGVFWGEIRLGRPAKETT